MCFEKINGKCAKNYYDYAYSYEAYRFAIPILFLTGIFGGWIGCGIWYGHYFGN